ncbi:hypothetical protein AJ78_06182 [Emergomyces pasteurianus Ep9510]|uniref:Uncharacterized protein n=1 Tax=Emergomyces pasteurianus Ep9510 TaxID=1447872 RepID=A0A1J9PBM2_9EURO|nr:hypothetical protein AJ78_06182 [Emergomyces pasteurianus Ep9510]
MKLLALTTLLGIAAGAAISGSQDGGSAVDVLVNLKSDPHGFKHVAKDGVARSYDRNGEVIDAERLSREQLLQVAATAHSEDEKTNLRHLWANVDTSSIDEAQLWAPPKHLLPSRFSDPNHFAKGIKDADVNIDSQVFARAKAQQEAKNQLQRRIPPNFCKYIKCAANFECQVLFTCGPCVEISAGVGHCMTFSEN